MQRRLRRVVVEDSQWNIAFISTALNMAGVQEIVICSNDTLFQNTLSWDLRTSRETMLGLKRVRIDSHIPLPSVQMCVCQCVTCVCVFLGRRTHHYYCQLKSSRIPQRGLDHCDHGPLDSVLFTCRGLCLFHVPQKSAQCLLQSKRSMNVGEISN